MKRLTTESTFTDNGMASIYDYRSGTLIGKGIADWNQYRLWSEGPSDVCAAHRCLSENIMTQLGISTDTTIFLLE
jgi:hypothetical protein